MKRAVLYLRVSTAEQAERDGNPEGYSIPAQREACQRKAQLMEVQVVDEYVDHGESARSADRPQLQAMLDRIEGQQDVHYVIVHKVDRLARNRLDDVTINVRMQQAGAALVSVSESIDATPSGQFLHAIMAANAEFFSRNLAQETKKGLRQKFESGGTVGLAPLGYLNTVERVQGQDVRSVTFDPDRASLVRWAFERYASGQVSIDQLHDELVSRGLTQRPTRKRPAKPISASTLYRILTNRYYLGYVTFEGVERRGLHEPLVPEELFSRVGQILKAHALAGERDRKHHHYLKGSIFCGRCGSRLVYSLARGKSGGHYPYFFCTGRQRRNGCKQRHVPVTAIEEAVLRYYMRIELPAEQAPRVRARLTSEHHAQQAGLRREAERSARRLTALENQRLALLQAYYAGAVTLDLLKREQDRLTAEFAQAQSAVASASVKETDAERVIALAVELGTDCGLAYLQAGDQERRDFNQAFFEKIYIKDGDEVAGVDYTPAFQDVMNRSRNASDPSPAPEELRPEGNACRPEQRFSRPGFEYAALGVSEGTRTPDRLDHNQELYQLSYAHQDRRE